MADDVLFRMQGQIAVITLNRPDQRNAINGAVASAMVEHMRKVEEDPEVRVAILTGSGDRAFSAGADLKAMAAGERDTLFVEPGDFAGFVRYPRTKPVIAAVNGLALAGGFEMVLACDIVVAVDEAQFGLPEVSRGIIAGGGGLFRLPRAIPPTRALELVLTAGRMGASEAHRLGLVNHVVTASELMTTAIRIAEQVCANAPLAVRESLAIARTAVLDETALWERSRTAAARVHVSADAREGPRAFAEKRQPRWTGR